MSILLSEEENPFAKGSRLCGVVNREAKEYAFEAGAKAQLKKVVEWGDGDCTEHDHGMITSGFSRHMCWECWQEMGLRV